MREIKFRGKAIMSTEELELIGIEHDNGWVYGNLIKNGNRPVITADIIEEIEESIYPEWWVVVDPKTVGQYTGLKDKNGLEIYEGDLLQHPNGTIAKIQYSDYLSAFVAVYVQNGDTEMDFLDKEIVNECEIVGNIYKNPELLVVEGK